MLNRLFYIYGIDTSSLYTDEEMMIEMKLNTIRRLKSLLNNPDCVEKKVVNDRIKTLKDTLLSEMESNKSLVREVRPRSIFRDDGSVKPSKKVSVFDSALTRALGLAENEFNDSMVIVRVYYFQIAESIIKNGFRIDGERYIFFSASAGQIRTKKLVAVKESLLNEHWNELTAGLTLDDINAKGGMNVNKYLVYTALASSATELWQGFDIDRCICVDDFETVITGKVDFIDKNTFEIERRVEDVPFNINDGAGMILPSLASTNFMIRLPFVKGLLGVFDFVRFIRENNCSPKIKDIYGDEHDIIEENIQVILTKSQFKMYKFWSSFKQYQEDFKKYHCTAGICNGMYTEDCDPIENSTINYQMIQTLYDLSPAELVQLAHNNIEDIRSIANTTEGKLKVFKATSWNKHKTGFQKCLAEYPPLLSDRYTRKTLREIKDKLEKDLWSAKFKINAKYTFVLPDFYAYCAYLFNHDPAPVGLLRDGEVCCRLYNHREKLDCLRSPHLYIEHPIRLNNTHNDWLTTDAVYISCHDMISRIIQCDFDGDKLLMTNEPILIEAAERINKKHKVVPLYYELGKAGAEIINDDSKYRGITFAFTHGNIGLPSNNITKIWNSGEIGEDEIRAIKLLVAEVNWTN